jgi:hypothetical protein
MAIVLADSQWAVYSLSQQAIIARDQSWPRYDGEAIEGADPDLVMLQQIDEPMPEYDSALYRAEQSEDINLDANTLTHVWTLVALEPSMRRSLLEAQITAQIPQVTATAQAIDPLITLDVLRYASAANDRLRALDLTTDANLADFDSAIVVLNPGADAEYSRFAASITRQDPWAGAPNNTLGFECVLQTDVSSVASGNEARLLVIQAPGDTGAVLPFVREGDLWFCRSRDGFRWADPSLPCSVQLLWAAGSLPVSRILVVPSAYQRVATAVRYGQAVNQL